MARPQISVFAAVSLDGYLATADDGLEWLQAAANPTDDHGFDELVDSVDAIAMGRRTWDHIADVPELPYRGRPIFVFTHQPPTAPRTGVTFWARTPEQAVVELPRRRMCRRPHHHRGADAARCRSSPVRSHRAFHRAPVPRRHQLRKRPRHPPLPLPHLSPHHLSSEVPAGRSPHGERRGPPDRQPAARPPTRHRWRRAHGVG
jgi:hypothetical protein